MARVSLLLNATCDTETIESTPAFLGSGSWSVATVPAVAFITKVNGLPQSQETFSGPCTVQVMVKQKDLIAINSKEVSVYASSVTRTS